MPQYFGRRGAVVGELGVGGVSGVDVAGPVGALEARLPGGPYVAAHAAVLDAGDVRCVDDAVGWMARELVQRFGFDRVMVLRSAEHLLTITATAFSQDHELAREANANAERHPVELRAGGLEVEMMRRRTAALVEPVGDPRAWHPITDQLATRAYVAAPVEAFGRTVATLHADAHFAGREVDVHDRDVLGVFAQACSGVVQRALLCEEVERLRAGVRATAEQLLAVSGGDAVGPSGAGVASGSMVEPGGLGFASAHPALTPRENEVLALMSRGATSREIARRLVVSTGTVKTHARNILRKLGAATRAEAVARAVELRQR